MSQGRRRRRRAAISAAVSLISLAGCAWWASKQQAPSIPTSAGALGLLVLAVALYGVIMTVRGWRWHVILRHAEVQHATADAYGLTAVAYMGNAVLPARGGELLRILLLSQRSSARASEILGTLIPERLLDAATLVVLFATLTLAGAAGVPSAAGFALAGLAALIGGFAGLVVYRRLRIAGRFERFATRVRPFVHASRLLLDRTGAMLFAVTVAIWLVEAGVLMLVALTLEIHISIGGAIAAVVFSSIAATVPAGPGYIGTFDAAALFAFHRLGVEGGTAVGLLLLYRTVVFVPITVTGLALVSVRYGGLATLRRRRESRLEVEPEPGAA